MTIEAVALTKIIPAIAKPFAKALFDKANSKINPTEFEQAFQYGIIAAHGEEEEKVNQLAEIFVMPDVQEKASRSFDFTEIENSPGQQRKLAQLDSSGRTFLAQELLEISRCKLD